MKVIVKEIPFEVKIRISELEKTLFNIKALKVGDKVRAKVLAKQGQESLLDLSGFRIKARMKFNVNIGEELTLRVVEKGENIKFELVRESEFNENVVKIVKEVLKSSKLTSDVEKAFENIKLLVDSRKIDKASMEKLLKDIFVKPASSDFQTQIRNNILEFINSKEENSLLKENHKEIKLLLEDKSGFELFKDKINSLTEEELKVVEDLKLMKLKIEEDLSSNKSPIQNKNYSEIEKIIEDIFKSLLQKEKINNSAGKFSNNKEVIEKLINLLSEKNIDKISKPEIRAALKEIFQKNQEEIKSLLKDKGRFELLKGKIMGDRELSLKNSESVKEGLNRLIKSVELIKNHNLSLKESSSHNPSLNITSFIIPIFSSIANKVNFAKVDYKRESRGKNFKLDRVSLLLNMSSLGRLIINFKKVGKVLHLEFLTENEDSKKRLSEEIDSLKKGLSPYFDSILTKFNISKEHEFEEFFEERIDSKESAIDIRV